MSKIRKIDQTKYTQIMNAELKVDVYAGESCEEHRPYWWMYAEGDMDGDSSEEPLILDLKNFPPGTIVTVEVPICPECGMDVELCKASEDCEFDWKQWVEERYS